MGFRISYAIKRHVPLARKKKTTKQPNKQSDYIMACFSAIFVSTVLFQAEVISIDTMRILSMSSITATIADFAKMELIGLSHYSSEI